MRNCSVHGCPELYTGKHSRCPAHRAQADKARPTRGTATKGHRSFRTAVITRDPICTRCRRQPSTVADHHPYSRRDLIDAGLNPNDPQYGRGLCKSCHDSETTRNQPGGFLITP